MPKRGGRTLQRISAAITGSGNEMMYHDFDKVYEAPSSAIAFPTELSSHFSAVALNRKATTILFRDAEQVRITIFPHFQDLGKPIPRLSIQAGMRPYNCKHVFLVPAEGKKDDWGFALSENGTTEFTLHVLKPYLYCLLSSFIQPSDSDSNVETEEIKALLKKKYPGQYARFWA
jgi:hypothetical protein